MFELLVYKPLAWILIQIYALVQNYGLSIILFTIIIKLLMLPLSIKQHKSMAKMQRVRPLMEYLQKKYKDDQQRLQQETMKLYKEEGVSPAGGCLPLLIQLPILIGLYQVINRPLTFILQLPKDVIAAMKAELIDAGITIGGEIDIYRNMGELSNKFAEAVAKMTRLDFNLFGIDFSQTPDFMGEITVLWLVPILAAATAYLSSYVTRKLQAMPQTEQQASSMKTMNMMMPMMSAVFCFMLPAGVGLYWIMSNVVQIAQTILLNKIFSNKNEEEEIDAEQYFKKDRNHRKKHQ
ncbi:MAG: YidC/Oxa1 family membrane protein insertase [Clostridia bacterium]|nr:YidC/Oxa1 family membrane protein insertase [Clostridia bacterium]